MFDKGERRPTYLGRTYDLSLNGTGILTDTNIFSASPVVILLAPPPLYKGHRPRIIEITARQLYCYYSGQKACFNLGFEFDHFKAGGIQMLRERLKSHRSLRTNDLITQIALARYVSA